MKNGSLFPSEGSLTGKRKRGSLFRGSVNLKIIKCSKIPKWKLGSLIRKLKPVAAYVCDATVVFGIANPFPFSN